MFEMTSRAVGKLHARVNGVLLPIRHKSEVKRYSPISILPDDVLYYLFSFTRDSEYFNHRLTIRISHVCRLWRRIAIDYALLWNRILYTAGQVPDMMRTFLERSKDSPLEIAIVLRKGGWERMSEVVDIFLPRISQLKTLSVIGRPDEMRSFLQHITADRHNLYASNLETISLRINSDIPHPIDMGAWFGGHTPKLRSFRLSGGLIPLNQPFLTNITSLSLNEYPSTSIPLIMSQCPQIKELSISSPPCTTSLAIPTLQELSISVPYGCDFLISPFLTPETWAGLIELKLYDAQLWVLPEILKKTPKLKRATLTHNSFSLRNFPYSIASLNCLVYLDINSNSSNSTILPFLDTPILKDLRLVFCVKIPRGDFIDYLVRNKPPLDSLHLQFFKPNTDELQSMLAELPFLEILSTQNTPGFGKNLLQVFTRYPELCPRLRSLDLGGCDHDSRVELDAFLRRRRQA